MFFANEVVSSEHLFECDALYRVIYATGREQISLTQPTNADITFGAQPHPDDPAALRTYEEHYLWDGVGNIVELRHVASGGSFTRRYRYATDGNRLLSSSAPGESSEPFSHSYSYDAHGNMTAMPHLAAMDWDHADRLQHCDLGGGGDVWFVYDASGTRVRKVRVNASGSSVRERIYLGDYELYRERAANSALPSSERQSLHVADDTGRICLVETRTVAEGDPVITPVSMLRYQHGNHLGSAALELDANAAVISYEEFHPFGTTSYAANDSGIEVSAKRYRYIGKERDEETGLYHLGARYYAAWLARWTASDPIGLADGVNRYAYVAGNPIGARDTTGTAGTTFQPGDVLSREQIAEYQKDRSVAGNTFPVLLPGGDQYYAVPNSAVRIAPGMPGSDAGHLAWSWHGTAGVAWERRYHETAEQLAAAESDKVGAQRILASKNMVVAVAIISGSIATGVASGGFLTARLMASGAGPLVSSTLGGGTAGAVQSSLSASGLTLLGGGGLRESLAAGVRAAPEGAAMGALSGYYLARVGLGFPSGGGSLSFRPRRTSAAPSGVAESSSPHGTGAGIDDAAAEGGVKKGPIPDQLPANLSEQLTLAEARATPATARPGMTLLADAPRLEANYGAGTWVKMQHVHQMPNNAGQINVHWFRNQTTGQNVEFKFKFRLADKVGVKRPPQEPISPTGTHGFP